jgi:hypothetical protein
MPVAANHGTDMISKIVPIGPPMARNTPEPEYHLVEALTVPPKFLHRKCEPVLCGVQSDLGPTRIVGSPLIEEREIHPEQHGDDNCRATQYRHLRLVRHSPSMLHSASLAAFHP